MQKIAIGVHHVLSMIAKDACAAIVHSLAYFLVFVAVLRCSERGAILYTQGSGPTVGYGKVYMR